jgi:electron transport complex protein RnfC
VFKTFPKGGVHPPENKISKAKAIETLQIPKSVSILLNQHLGAPATPIVQVGDKILTGQLIAKAEGFISANIHSSVSGTVKKIESLPDTSGYKKTAIVIETDGDEWLPGIDRSTQLKPEFHYNREELIAKIADAGIVGMGGATFPTHVKLSVPKGKKAEYLLINGVECEPFLTCDHRLMLEKGHELMVGIRILMKALDVNSAIIGIEKNKPDAISYLKELTNKHIGIKVQPLTVKYPQGGEKQLVKALLNREVPSGGIPVDIGAVAFNVGTVFAVYEAVQKNKPLIERVVTVSGKSAQKASNFQVRIGTSMLEVIEAAGGISEDIGKIVNGGPMMGKAVVSADIPIVKGCSGILLIPEDESKRNAIQSCIRCAKCVSACPINLEPYLMMILAEKQMFDRLENENVTDCIECGCCTYTCPANRPLLDYIRLGKSTVIKNIRSRKK